MDFPEVRSVRLVPLPALAHKVVNLLRAVLRLMQEELQRRKRRSEMFSVGYHHRLSFEPTNPARVLAVVLVKELYVLDDFLVAKILVRLFASERQDLPEGDRERPDVALRGELAEQDALPGHPTDRQHGLALQLVVVRGVEVPAHAEIGHLDAVVAAYEAVPANAEEEALSGSIDP